MRLHRLQAAGAVVSLAGMVLLCLWPEGKSTNCRSSAR